MIFEKRNFICKITLVLYYLIFMSTTHSYAQTDKQFKKFDEKLFSFETPISWTQMNEREIELFKSTYIEQNNNLFLRYHGYPEKYKPEILDFVGFSAQWSEVRFVAYTMEITSHWKPYLTLSYMYLQSKKFIAAGKDLGNVKNIFSNKRMQINDVPALEIDLELYDGSRVVSYSIYSAYQPKQISQVNIIYKSGKYDSYHNTINHILKSLYVKNVHTIHKDLLKKAYELIESESENLDAAMRIFEDVLSKDRYNPIALNNIAYILIKKYSKLEDKMEKNDVYKAYYYLDKAMENYLGQLSDKWILNYVIEVQSVLTTISAIQVPEDGLSAKYPFIDTLKKNLKVVNDILEEK